jgi:hypothetical protein
MAGKFTCKSYQIAEAPRKITLRGNKTTKQEPAQHIIEFPGGAIELSRLDDGSYWAHIIVNNEPGIDDCEGLVSVQSEVVDSRIDYAWPADPNIIPIPDAAGLHQIAVRIKPTLSNSSIFA